MLKWKLPISLAITQSQILCVMWIKGMYFHTWMRHNRVSQNFEIEIIGDEGCLRAKTRITGSIEGLWNEKIAKLQN